ncbi:H-type small acid-soluble spore protein [Bacillus sp. PS06]|uniref:H-type small acid-soluble spore protein n=1 Tax=Bacillus sp. PS06 TaxID=2764176 RepID=UPI001785D1F3|nr:H-type small acid-soluble spore protein [Bacillus sp. PS06]MBD8070512.1 H-type small acid-soluble spore protein [Bacillus sp. PS06]
MDIRRAKQIISSPDDITVHYHGQSVWIDSCDEQGNLCTVHMRGNEHEKSSVAVTELEEM